MGVSVVCAPSTTSALGQRRAHSTGISGGHSSASSVARLSMRSSMLAGSTESPINSPPGTVIVPSRVSRRRVGPQSPASPRFPHIMRTVSHRCPASRLLTSASRTSHLPRAWQTATRPTRHPRPSPRVPSLEGGASGGQPPLPDRGRYRRPNPARAVPRAARPVEGGRTLRAARQRCGSNHRRFPAAADRLTGPHGDRGALGRGHPVWHR